MTRPAPCAPTANRRKAPSGGGRLIAPSRLARVLAAVGGEWFR